VKTLFAGRQGAVPTAEVVPALAGRYMIPPDMPAELCEAFQIKPMAPLLPTSPAGPELAAVPATGEPARALDEVRPASESAREPLAIIGIGCRLPGGVRDAESFWNFMMAGGDAIVDIPAERWDPKRYHDPTGKSPGRAYVQRAGLLQGDIKAFDAAFFGISPREAEVMDPQQRLLLETSWEALEDAGIPPASLAGSRTGVFTGGFTVDNLLLRTREGQREDISSVSGVAGTMTMLSSRLSYFYDLRGPSLTIDTACSSSLVAAHHACESLWRGESDMALVAGVNALLLPEMQVVMAKGQFLSPKGRCHAFGADADGYVRGEGAAVVVVRPLSAALREGQRVYAVIRGTACNQDGRTAGITVPNGAAQVAVMREAYEKAGVSPRDVAYVEAHGTGTPVGDPIEAGAIGEVVGAGRRDDESCVMASVKTNLGHLEAAAGVTGLIKAALCLQHGVAPPHLNATRPNPAIPLHELGLVLPQAALPLKRRGGPLLAGVNSFGYGGTNAHVVLSEAPAPHGQPARAEAPPRQTLLLPLSARSRESLGALCEAYAGALESGRDSGRDKAGALARTAALHRAHHRHRAVLVAGGAAELADAARGQRFAAQAECESEAAPVFVFSGMGPQWWAMGRQLFASEPAYRASVERSDAIFRRIAGWSILEELQRDEAHSRITQTEFAQPANAVLQIGLSDLWASWGIRPAAVIGHSIGEVAAAHAAGTLDVEQALQVAFHRSRLQQRLAGRGGMLAAGMSVEEAQVCVQRYGPGIALAAVNGAKSVTLAGRRDSLQRVLKDLEAAGTFARLLQVEVPYHSPVMDEIEHDLRSALAHLRPQAPTVPVYSTVTGAALPAPWHDATYWWRNVRQTVQFAPALQAAMGDGHRHFLEIGPHPVLASAMRDALREAGVGGEVLASLSHKEPDDLAITRALGKLYVLGSPVDWLAYYGPGLAVAAPKYPWNRRVHWRERESLQRERQGAFPVHPLLVGHEPGPVSSWTAELNLGRSPAWLDHVAAGAPLFPAAGFIELALSARAHISGQASASLEHVDFVAPLALDPASAQRITVHNASDAAAFRISARQGDAAPTLCVRGNWYATPEPQEQEDVETIAAGLPHEMSPAALYQRLAQMGLAYGPAFQAVQHVRHSAHQVMARLAIAPEHAHGFAISPMLLDAALHSMLALGGDTFLGCELVPTGIQSLSFFRSPGTTAVVLGRLDTTGSTPRCDLTLLDANGGVCARLRGLEFKVLRKQEDKLPALACERRHVPCEAPVAAADSWSVPIVLGAPLGLQGDWLNAEDDEALAAALTRARTPCSVLDLRFLGGGADADAAGDAPDTASVADAAASAAARLLKTLQAIAPQQVQRYVVVTRYAEQVLPEDPAPRLASAGVVGLARSAMSERPDLRLTLIEVDQLSSQLCSLIEGLGTQQEWALRGGQWFGARVLPADLAPLEARRLPFERGQMACRLLLGKAGKLDSLEFEQTARVAPGPGEVEIAVDVAPLGYKDVMKSLGVLSSLAMAGTFFGDELGMECAGRIVAVGEGVERFAVGDRVYAAAPGTLRSHVVCNARTVARLPTGVGNLDGASLVAFGTVYHAFVNVARVARGERVLIHGATGGVGMAAIQVARWLGAEVFATAGSEAKREYLRQMGIAQVSHSRDTRFHDDVMRWTAGRGVDVVLNFTPGDILLKGVSCLARFGRFIEIGKVAFDQDTALPLRAFTENLSFSAIDFDRMTQHKPGEVRAIAEKVLEHLAAGDFAAPPAQVFAAAHVAEAFRTLARGEHIGRVVVDMSAPQLTVLAQEPALIDAGKTYLVTGGLGGFGLEVARSLLAQGARHQALLSRRGAASDDAAQALVQWQQQGLGVRAFAVDVADAKALQRTLREIRATMPELKGVFHAAAVLDDRPLEAQDRRSIDTAFAAKARGAWNLHQLTRAMALDFFVLCSSISAVIGNARQANYAAANHFVDQLAALRRSQGLPAQSIQWGVLGDSGMVARNAGLGRVLAQQGIAPLSNRTALAALKSVLERGAACPAALLVAQVDWPAMAGRQPAWTGGGRLAHWLAEANGGGGVRQRWADGSATDLHQRVQEELRRITGEIMKIAPADIEPATSLRDMGMDSLMALEISVAVEAAFGVTLPTMVLAGGPALREVAQKLVDLLGGSAAGGPQTDGSAPARAAASPRGERTAA
jgi:acyl transferase domain-containing protein/NADPH:quinone reductase-like Zn-dependent oxidoreductase/NAD(P)-dependent dehydrogenase (short-subunit alcohol dehydrogenase family)/acyl carrier protein